MERFEYKIISTRVGGFVGGKLDLDELCDSMNQLGDEGWELVSCPTIEEHEGTTRTVVSIFKRSK